jgi:hypothetical protein
MLGKFFEKGAEICRVADISELQVLVRIAEQQLSDIEAGQDVRVKARSFPDRTFRGKVSRIGGEMEMTAEGQRYYRVGLTIRNEEDLLRPGMTVFTRVDSNGRTPLACMFHKGPQREASEARGYKAREAWRAEAYLDSTVSTASERNAVDAGLSRLAADPL